MTSSARAIPAKLMAASSAQVVRCIMRCDLWSDELAIRLCSGCFERVTDFREQLLIRRQRRSTGGLLFFEPLLGDVHQLDDDEDAERDDNEIDEHREEIAISDDRPKLLRLGQRQSGG